MDVQDAGFSLRAVDPGLLPAFRPYLTDRAARDGALGRADVLTLGAVTAERRTCAAAAGQLDGAVLTVTSLYVDPAVRRRGIGSALLAALLERAAPRRAELSWLLPRADHEAFRAFLTAAGFSPAPQAGGGLYRTDAGSLRLGPTLRRAFSPAFRPDGNVVPLAALAGAERAELLADPAIDPRLGLARLEELYSPEVSFAYRYGGRVAAYLACALTGPRDGAILAAVSRPGAHPAAILHLAAAALRAGLDHFGGDFAFWADTVNRESADLLLALSKGRCQLWLEGSARWERA